MKILISDNLAPVGAQILLDAGLEVDIKTGLAPEDLKKIIPEYEGLIIRSATKVTAEIIEAATNLKVLGRAGIGLDNVDVAAASKHGIVVMNAPDGNSTTAAEHAIAMMVSQGLKMKVIAYDPHMPEELVKKLGVELTTIDEVCKKSDFISVHVPMTKDTKHLITKPQFKSMKKDAMFIDCARGGVVDEEALYEALAKGLIAGAALDVFEVEPTSKENCPLLGLDNFICTPHLGASTSEAQENVAVAIAKQISEYLRTGVVSNAVNVPSVSSDVLSKVGPYLTLAEMLGFFHMQVAKGGVEEVNLEYIGEFEELTTGPITVAFLKGLFTPILQDAVNYVNAPLIAKERGIRVVESKTGHSDDFTSLLSIRVKTTDGENMLAGTVFGKNEPRLVRLNTFRLEALPTGPMLFVYNKDVPGVIGALGTTLGKHEVNISRMTVGREKEQGRNIILLNTDNMISKELLKTVQQLDYIDDAMALVFPHYADI
jgi:D-3-phosphoglycerate dehydrogenase